MRPSADQAGSSPSIERSATPSIDPRRTEPVGLNGGLVPRTSGHASEDDPVIATGE
jgi:hypothetical protein